MDAVFEYDPKKYNVIRVTHESFQRCNTTTPQAIYATGNDSIPIKGTGHLYFICGFPGHCQSGQKIDIRVSGSSRPTTAPAPAPAPSPFGSSSGSDAPSLRHSRASLLLLLHTIFTALACWRGCLFRLFMRKFSRIMADMWWRRSIKIIYKTEGYAFSFSFSFWNIEEQKRRR